MFDDFVRDDKTPFFKAKTGSSKQGYLLWGDGVRFVGSTSGVRIEVTARGGRQGWVEKAALGGESLLEFYFIDVGQGDGVLIKTPDFRHVMIDGGFPRSMQETGKNAADFVDWKFVKDYGKSTIALDVMMASHNDADHYGGLMDMLDAAQAHELDASGVTIENFYHAGLSWWKTASSKTLGSSKSVDGSPYWTQLLGNRSHAVQVTGSGSGPRLHGWWAEFIEFVTKAKTKSGGSTPIERLSHVNGYVPGFAPGGAGAPSIKVLGPVEFDVHGQPGLRKFSGGNSKNTNGVSLLLRVDYGRSRTLLTGDLNTVSQHSLLEDYAGDRLELQCDVAKACHHGSADVSYRFLQAMQPAATIISSGDNEGHDHPRPAIVSASATTGYLQIDQQTDKLLTPLVYSTELARSIDLGEATKIETTDGNTTTELKGVALERSRVFLKKAKRDSVELPKAKIVGGLIYGLVNVRTDGDKILCATLDEKNDDWRIESFRSRF